MLKKHRKHSPLQMKRIGLLGLVLTMFVLPSFAQQVSIGATEQTSYGDCSPVVNDTGGDVTIHCQGLSEKEATRLLGIVHEALQGFDSLETIAQQTRMLENLLDQVDGQKLTILELESTIEHLSERVQDVLSDDAISDEVKALISEGNIEAAETLVDSYAEELERQDQQLAAKHYERGRVKELRTNYGEALTSFEKAAVLQPDNSTYLNAAVKINPTLGEYTKAIEYYELALHSGLKTYGEDHPRVAIYRNNLGMLYESLGDYAQAMAYYDLALNSHLRNYEEDHLIVAVDRSNLGAAYDGLWEYAQAMAYYELALNNYLGTAGEEHPDAAILRNNLGFVYDRLEEYTKAIKDYELAFVRDSRTYGKDYPTVATLRLVDDRLREYAQAIAYYELALNIDLKIYGEDHPRVALARNNLGSVYYGLGEYDKAIEYCEQSLNIFILKLGLEHSNTKLVEENLRLAKAARGELE